MQIRRGWTSGNKMTGSSPYLMFLLLVIPSLVIATPTVNSPTAKDATAGGFQSGLLYVTPQGRLKMPSGSVLIMTPTLTVPVGDDLPLGHRAQATVSVPFSFDFDVLGLTDINNLFGLDRVAREAPSQGSHPGGDRTLVYRVAENTIQSAGLDGRACLLRAICELHWDSNPQAFGLLGEILHLLLSPTKSPESLGEYTEAEKQGSNRRDCTPYHAKCPYSFFFDQDTTTNTTTSTTTPTNV